MSIHTFMQKKFYKILLLFILAVISASFITTQNPEQNQETAESFSDLALKKHIWVSIDHHGNPKTVNYQTRTIQFIPNQHFEVQRTFEYSGSTFKFPGKYIQEGDQLRLISLNGTELGLVSIKNHRYIKIKWLHPGLIDEKSTEIYKMKDKKHPSHLRVLLTKISHLFSAQ